jgi:hypothetical protein
VEVETLISNSTDRSSGPRAKNFLWAWLKACYFGSSVRKLSLSNRIRRNTESVFYSTNTLTFACTGVANLNLPSAKRFELINDSLLSDLLRNFMSVCSLSYRGDRLLCAAYNKTETGVS